MINIARQNPKDVECYSFTKALSNFETSLLQNSLKYFKNQRSKANSFILEGDEKKEYISNLVLLNYT